MATRDRWQNALTALMGAKGVDPRAFYLARVLRGYDNAADLDPELDAFPPMSVIPVRTFAPGVIVKPQRGRLCLFGFEHADLARPYIAQFVATDSGTALRAARDTDGVDLKLFISPDLVGKVAIGVPLGGAVVPVMGRGAIDGGSLIVRIE